MLWLTKEEDWWYLRYLDACLLPEQANKLGLQDLTAELLEVLAVLAIEILRPEWWLVRGQATCGVL